MAPATAPEPGTVIDGKYRVEGALGRGGMGVVLEATHLSLGKRVALKVLRADAADGQARMRFAREGRIAAQLPEEHIAAVSDFGQTSAGEPYLVMELLVGNDLERELATRGPLPIPEAVDLVLQACEGVAEAHAVGLVHRDLKPSNLFLTRRRDGSPLVKVLDFGLSKATNEGQGNLTATESTFGTPQYMSPEQIRSAKYVDARTDQHALAMILYELVTGRPPYLAESATGLYVVISTAAPTPIRSYRSDVPAGLEAAILRALAKDSAGRFPDLAGFGAAVAPFGGPGALASARCMAVALGHEPPRTSSPQLAPVPPVALPAPGRTTLPVAAPTPAVASVQQVTAQVQAVTAPVQTVTAPVQVVTAPVQAVAPPVQVVAPAQAAARLAPLAAQHTQSALVGAPHAASSNRTKVAVAVVTGVGMLLGASFVVQQILRAPTPGAEPASTAVPASTVVPSDPAPVATAAATAPATAPSATEAAAPAPSAPAAVVPEAPASSAGAEGAATTAKPLHPRTGKPAKKTVDSASDIFGTRHK